MAAQWDWIVMDNQGQVHARINNADRAKALGIVRVSFPEFEEGSLRLISRYSAKPWVRRRAAKLPALTPARLAARDITWKPDVPTAARQLQKRFARTSAAGGAS